mmetsp:Transcript_25203/g.49097  ORF Transcript_25203/g.49097 Transcript_25203/m.49097 type:complete len:201 (-) Transcript_25203:141-743(-)
MSLASAYTLSSSGSSPMFLTCCSNLSLSLSYTSSTSLIPSIAPRRLMTSLATSSLPDRILMADCMPCSLVQMETFSLLQDDAGGSGSSSLISICGASSVKSFRPVLISPPFSSRTCRSSLWMEHVESLLPPGVSYTPLYVWYVGTGPPSPPSPEPGLFDPRRDAGLRLERGEEGDPAFARGEEVSIADGALFLLRGVLGV